MDVLSGILLLCLAVGLYVVCSLYLLRNPWILHKKKRLEFYCRHISHRGGSGEKIENTMEAFTHAVAVGTEMLEMDCHLTSDGYVVISHDYNLMRQTGYDKTVSSLRFQDLPLYEERLEVTFYVGHYSTGKDRKFVLLEDLFKKFPSMPMILEIKENNDLLIKKVSNLVKQYHRESFTVWASEESDVMAKCNEQNPSMPYMFTMKRGILLLLLFYTGLLPFVPLGESLLLFYLPSIINRTYIPEEAILKKRFVVYLLQKLTMRKSLFEHLIKRGLQVQLFVCNEESDMEAAFAVGATGVMSDYPTLLTNYIKKHPPPPPPPISYFKGNSKHCIANR
ncbi:glycerophosphodiester phosphodiesterase domain-containing protein 3 [Sinocyclocheilus grahami]|uniref:glycerophosphodiester phosphodiesterase domain-containing protein 3 n=1 Tax=Sinocyclocheilus grahami TaxID=75366 RepID=UPI0007AD4B51|nr:PREDICTED: glycerophosphodiester phosphodiesterase domain-containing protein 3-like [Sinocyclocheilus grahami]